VQKIEEWGAQWAIIPAIYLLTNLTYESYLRMNSTSEISYLHDVIASRDRYIVQIELELYRLRGILMSRDQQIQEMAIAYYPHSNTTDSAEVSSAPIEIVTIVSTNATASSAATASSTATAESLPVPEQTVEAVETVAVDKTRRIKRKANDYLVEGDVIKHTATELQFIYTGDTFVTEDGTVYNSLSDIVKKHKVSKSPRNGFEACEVQRGSTWIKISELEKHTE
jgi:hypothetical protein